MTLGQLIILVGLGNPGPQYALNRHNIGYMAIDVIAESYHFPPFKTKFQASISEGRIGNHKVILCKPLTYMNVSGHAVRDLANFYKIPTENIFVFHDDLDLEPGRLKIKQGGGHGGHNGLKSLDQSIGNGYHRIRLGIGHPGHKDDVTPYVLGNFSKEDQKWLIDLLQDLTNDTALLIEDPGRWLSNRSMP